MGDVPEHLAGRGEDVAAAGAGPDRLPRRLLDRLDLGEEILKLGVRLAQDGHPAEVADIALVVAAGVDRHRIALAPDLVGRRAVEAGAGGDQAILEGEVARHFLAAERLDHLELGGARTVSGDGREHRIDHAFGGEAKVIRVPRGVFLRPEPLQRHGSIDDSRRGQLAPEHFLGIGGQEGALDADRSVLAMKLAEPLDHRRHRALGSPGTDEFRHPEFAELALVVLHRVADIGRVLRLAAEIDEKRQVAGEADRIEMLEEEEAIGAADQVLDVVLGGDDENVDSRPFKERVEQLPVERECRRPPASGRLVIACVHDAPPHVSIVVEYSLEYGVSSRAYRAG